MSYLDKEAYLEKHYKDHRVKIYHSSKSTYIKLGILHTYGTVVKISGSQIGVEIDDMKNDASSKGIFWFTRDELRIVNDNKGDVAMTGYKNIAVVNLLEDYNKKDYYFALFDEDYKGIVEGTLVVVNARGKDQRVLGRVKEIIPVENYDKTVTAQVVAVVDETNYNARLDEEVRLKEIAKKKAAIEKELEEEIAKRKTLEFYEKMAEEYKDNPRLAELVAELKVLGA